MSIDNVTVIDKYIAATNNHISKAMNVSEIISNPDVVRSNTAMTLTIAECLIRLTIMPAKGGSIIGIAWGKIT